MKEESEFENSPINHRHFQVQFFFNGLKVGKSNYLKSFQEKFFDSKSIEQLLQMNGSCQMSRYKKNHLHKQMVFLMVVGLLRFEA